MIKITAHHILAFIVALTVALAIAWGTSSYYGDRKIGQEYIMPSNSENLTYSLFSWPMNSEWEVTLDPEHIGPHQMHRGRFNFTTVQDTYFNLNMYGQKLIAVYNFIFSLKANIKSDSYLSLTISSGKKGYKRLYVSEKIKILKGEIDQDIDLSSLTFHPIGETGLKFVWGKDIDSSDSLRIDWDTEIGSEVSIDSISVKQGVSFEYALEDFFDNGSQDGVGMVPSSRGLKLLRGSKSGTFITPRIGVGSIEQFLDLNKVESEGLVSMEVRSGKWGDDETILWSDWTEVGEDGSISSLEVLPYIQIRFNLQKQGQHPTPGIKGFRLRVLDQSPPGLDGPLFGTYFMPTLMPGTPFSDILKNSTPSRWVHLPFANPQFDWRLNDLIASDVSIVASINLDLYTREKIFDVVKRYSGRVLVWALYSTGQQGALFFSDIFARVKEINPIAIVFPVVPNQNYFQDLALDGLKQFAVSQGTQEEILDRGFWFYFVIALIGILIIFGLGPVIGYNFHFGPKELMFGVGGLAAEAVILIPILTLTGLTALAFPRDFAQLQIAFNHFALSATLQELMRAMMILLPVRYLMKTGLDEKKAWIVALLASSVLFGLSHLGYPGMSGQEITGFIVVTTIAGLIFGAVFYYTRSLSILAVIHLLSNIFFSTMTTIGPRY